MRLVVPTATVALLCLAMAAAQPTPTATDPSGDQVVLGAAPAGDNFPSADLTGLTFTATVNHLNVTLELANLDTHRPYADTSLYEVEFAFDGSRYLVLMERLRPVLVTVPTEYSADLRRWDDGLGYWVSYLPMEPAIAGNAITVTIPLQALTDPTGLPARNGSILADIVAHAAHGQDYTNDAAPTPVASPVGAPYVLSDRMPDDGFATYTINIPVTGGAVLLDSPDPVRVTNGGPGTFVYPVRATSASDEPITVDLAIEGLPAGWTASIVDARMELAAQESRTTQAVVKPPFAHLHGASANITVTAAVDGQPSDSTLLLQLLYSDPAQPAGHHPRLFLHAQAPRDPLGFNAAYELATGFSVRTAYMNTLAEDPADLGKPVNGVGRDAGDQWRIPLSPALGMGLDFDLNGAGHVTAAFASDQAVEIPDATFTGQIVLETSEGDVVLARAAATAPAAVAATSPTGAPTGTEVQLELAMTPAADYVPYAPDTSLVLLIQANYTEPGARIGYTGLNLLPGGWMELPLMEYQDLIPLQQLGALAIRVDPEQASANPEDSVAFTLTLQNDGAEAVNAAIDRLDVSASAILDIDQDSIRIPAGAQGKVQVLVKVPAEAVEGELFNAFIAIRPDGQESSILVRMTTLVTTEQEIESAQDLAKKESPTLHWLALAMFLGLAAKRRR